MKKTLPLSVGALLFLFAGCVTSSINVIEKKTPTKPYSKVLVVYVNEGCDFTLFDSLTYNICLKSCFLNTDSYETRVQAEDLLAGQLTTATEIVKATDVLDIANNDYDYFRRMIDSLHVDALLMVGLGRHSGVDVLRYAAPGVIGSRVVSPGGNYKGRTFNSTYDCFLMSTSSIYIPVWHAAIEIKANADSKSIINGKVTRDIARSLKRAGYWMH
ncbi:hypothetical protein Q4E93_01185 [Flavitalea sp. BT771]|uniref:hypothetical protein n=1 Tax=Flavitalea sp. BT771 TaxID=3063329 RepID=UPI0026E38DB3|nr:hypothetical protein [Flavitalea sp. BT771]MDO6429180.1 hypothetical protein [Flavitalea sp. BT771]MDV6218692.1 hypothetical protein [Flavitalea sp. BT771]